MSSNAVGLHRPVVGKKRAGKRLNREARQRLKSFPLSDWAALAFIVAAGAGFVGLVGLIVGTPAFVVGALMGLAAGVLGSAVLWLVLEHTDARSFAIGGVAEEQTASALGRLGRAWRRIDDVPFNGDANIDHLLVGPTGVFAVETKFTAKTWLRDREGHATGFFESASANATRLARKASLVLLNHGRPAVVPMLVVWGPGAPQLVDGAEWIDGVLVCRGSDAGHWLRVIETMEARYTDADVDRFIDAVGFHINVQEGQPTRG